MGNRTQSFLAGFIGVMLGVIITLAAIVPKVNENIAAKTPLNNQTNIQSENNNIKIGDLTNLYTNAVDKAMPSVVGITSEFTKEVQMDLFSYLYGEGPVKQKGEVIGTGLIVDSNGYVLTNSHVVIDGKVDKVTVLLNDGSSETATVKWSDQSLDLAILKMEGSGYPVADLGDSDKVRVGDIAIAIGNPFGLNFERTVTQGIISGIGRSISSPEIQMNNLIQTDASINEGNSGGPLLNVNGQVVGLNTIKVSGEGLGFSVPINTAKVFVDIIKENGEIKEKPLLGITGVSTSQIRNSQELRFPEKDGVLVVKVQEGSPAQKAGLKSGDIITCAGEDNILNMSDLIKSLYTNTQNSDKLSLKILPYDEKADKHGEEKQVEVDFSDARIK